MNSNGNLKKQYAVQYRCLHCFKTFLKIGEPSVELTEDEARELLRTAVIRLRNGVECINYSGLNVNLNCTHLCEDGSIGLGTLSGIIPIESCE